ncbi:MAG: hypothetical protein ACXW1W_19195 [Methylococcaceae bacterium]
MPKEMYALLFTILGGVIGICGAMASAFIGANRQNRNDANVRLVAAFTDELAILTDVTDKSDPYKILAPAAKKHLMAVIGFKYVICKSEAIAFDKAWRDYYEEDGYPSLEQYVGAGNIDESEKRRRLAIKRIEHILSFAQYRRAK